MPQSRMNRDFHTVSKIPLSLCDNRLNSLVGRAPALDHALEAFERILGREYLFEARKLELQRFIKGHAEAAVHYVIGHSDSHRRLVRNGLGDSLQVGVVRLQVLPVENRADILVAEQAFYMLGGIDMVLEK